MEHDLNDFWHKIKMYNFEPYNVLLAITNIPVLLLCSGDTHEQKHFLLALSRCMSAKMAFLASCLWSRSASRSSQQIH